MQYGAQLAEKLPMRQEFQATIAIKHAGGVGFGTAYWMQGDRVAFTTDAELHVDQHVEMRMDLSSYNDKARGQLLILQVQDSEEDLSTCLGQILEMPREDFEVLNKWLEDMAEGNSASHSSRWLRSLSPHRSFSGQASEEETAAALKRMDVRQGSVAPGDSSQSGLGVPTKRRVGRSAIRAALRANIPIPEPNDSEPVKQPTILDEPEIVTVSETAPPETDNSIAFNYSVSWQGPNNARVQWTTKAALGHTWRSSLKKGFINLKTPSDVDKGSQIKLSLVLPDGQAIAIRSTAGETVDGEVKCLVRVPWGTRIKMLHILND